MRLYSLDQIKTGQVLGKSVYGDSGNMLLGAGVELTESLLEKLEDNNIHYIYIDDDESKGIEPKPIIEDHVMIKTVKSIKEVMESSLYDNKAKGRSGVVPLKMYSKIMDTVNELLKALQSNGNLMYTVTELMGTDMYTYKHSVNVTILSILTAKALGYKDDVIKCIAMGALLHDIGKIKVSTELINKNEKVTDEEMEELKKHSAYGYDLVREDVALSGYTKQIIRLHHEKLDGSGYPLGLFADEIPDFVQIVTIADMFDAMTSDRSYRLREPVYKVIEILMAEAIEKIKPSILKVFIRNICVYPPGTTVVLCDGRVGVVVDYRKTNPDRPIIRITKDEKVDYFYEIDLMRELTTFVVDVIG